MARVLAAVFVAMVCAACIPSGSPDSFGPTAGLPRGIVIPVHTDQPGDPALAQSIAWWNELAGRTLFAPATTDAWDGIWVYHVAYANCTDPGARACTSVADASGTERSPGDFAYRWCDIMLQPGESAWNVLSHEEGHCLGFGHVSDRPSIMGATSADPSNPAGDQAMLRAGGY